ncbi:MAG: aspartate--tRNA(Asn) ligase [Candidatus Fermentibacteria bacterium]|nr:aspartate--tRNA(Asn) ligase [Candidatus Fermentibacteria bacterium]
MYRVSTTADQKLLSAVELSEMDGQKVTVHGMIQRIRRLGWGAFIVLRRHDGLLQCVIGRDGNEELIDGLAEEQSVLVIGLVKSAKIKDKSINPGSVEIQVEEVKVISVPAENTPVDLSKKILDLHIDTNLDLRPLSLRHPVERARLKISEAFAGAFAEFLRIQGFTEIRTPKIGVAGAEGGANIFTVDYFGRPAYLAQSPQFYKQMGVGIFERVFEVGPVFRAEPHQTSRHINEYTSLDFEMGFLNDHTEVMQMETVLLKYCFEHIQKTCAPELALLEADVPVIQDDIPVVTLAEAHEIAGKATGKDYSAEPDLEPEEERALCTYSSENWDSDFVFVTHFPTEKRPFYTKDDPDNPGTTLSFDLLFRGLEVTTGGQRINDYQEQIDKMKSMGLNPDDFSSYLQAHKYGLPPHGGLAIGLERITARLLGVDNIRLTTMFPRDIKRLTP